MSVKKFKHDGPEIKYRNALKKSGHFHLWPKERRKGFNPLRVPNSRMLTMEIYEGKAKTEWSLDSQGIKFHVKMENTKTGSDHRLEIPKEGELNIFAGRMTNLQGSTALVPGRDAVLELKRIIEGYRSRLISRESEVDGKLTSKIIKKIIDDPEKSDSELLDLVSMASRIELIKLNAFGENGKMDLPDFVLMISNDRETISAASGSINLSSEESGLVPFLAGNPNCFIVGSRNDEVLFGEEIHIRFRNSSD